MKKLAVLLSFFYVSWNACYDGARDYTGKKEDRYGIKHSTVAMTPEKLEEDRKGGYISFGGRQETCVRRHATFENSVDLKTFLRRAPQEVSDIGTLEITGAQ